MTAIERHTAICGVLVAYAREVARLEQIPREDPTVAAQFVAALLEAAEKIAGLAARRAPAPPGRVRAARKAAAAE